MPDDNPRRCEFMRYDIASHSFKRCPHIGEYHSLTSGFFELESEDGLRRKSLGLATTAIKKKGAYLCASHAPVASSINRRVEDGELFED